jgi:hypothetical protein
MHVNASQIERPLRSKDLAQLTCFWDANLMDLATDLLFAIKEARHVALCLRRTYVTYVDPLVYVTVCSQAAQFLQVAPLLDLVSAKLELMDGTAVPLASNSSSMCGMHLLFALLLAVHSPASSVLKPKATTVAIPQDVPKRQTMSGIETTAIHLSFA